MAASPKGIGERSPAHGLLMACGVIGPLFFIAVFLVEGARRAGYNPLCQPVSALSIGDSGWVQAANFIITGLLLFAFAVGLRRMFRSRPGGSTLGPVLIGLVAIGLIGAGIFTSDPLNGYPPGTPPVPTVRSGHGRLHDLFGIPVFLGLPIACFVFGRRFARLGERGWAACSILAGFIMLAAFVLAGMGFEQAPGLVDFAGLFQRISLIAGLGWVALLAAHYYSHR